MANRICPVCGKILPKRKKTFCSNLCAKVHRSRLAFPTLDNCIECKECGMRSNQLYKHIKTYHMPIEEYCKKHGIEESQLISSTSHEKMSAGQKLAFAEGRSVGWGKGDNNPSRKSETKSGRNSVWSMNFKGYDGLSDDEKRKRISEVAERAKENRNARHNNRLRIDYYTSRGFSLKEARKILSKNQSNFSLAGCIQKYGPDKGREIWQARQDRWQATMKSKPLEEIERINRSKFKNTGYSEISQKLFRDIERELSATPHEIYYATNGKDSTFNEYMVHDDQNKRNYFLDFYIKDLNCAIEFDGYFWHDKLSKHKVDKDHEREQALIRLGYKILRIKEMEYRKDPDTVLEKCMDFIQGIANG